VDVWLWAVRLYKSRSAATAACRGGHVRVNRAAAKAATSVKVGDQIEAFVERERILEVVAIIDKLASGRSGREQLREQCATARCEQPPPHAGRMATSTRLGWTSGCGRSGSTRPVRQRRPPAGVAMSA